MKCESIMSKIYPSYYWSDSDPPSSITSLVHILDIAVISYVGAHLPRDWFPDKVISAPSNKGYPRFCFKQRSFKCLDSFLSGCKAWVCHRLPEAHLIPSTPKSFEPELYLATDAATFADIWGPMWSEKYFIDNDYIWRYRVGSGVLVAWKSDDEKTSRTANHYSNYPPLLASNERLCHWISDRDYNQDHQRKSISEHPLRRDDILVIGAGEILKPNVNCSCNRVATKQKLRDGGFFHEPQTSNKRRYIESETVLAQVGWSGISAGLQINYKIRERTWKQVIVERWKNEPERRVPRILEYWLGVEVSMCTQNARRRRLISLLGSKTMNQFLKTLSLNWKSKECKEAFFAAIENPDHKTFGHVWEAHPDWQPDFGKAVGYCLDVLAESGTSEGGLKAFWIPEYAMEIMVELKSKDHTWAEFLKDSSACCAMAVFEDTCLEVTEPWGRSCQDTFCKAGASASLKSSHAGKHRADHALPQGASAFETAIVLNRNCLPPGLVHCAKPWDLSSLSYGEKLAFGENGGFKVIAPIDSTSLLVTWKAELNLNRLLRRNSTKYHHEYIRDENYEDEPLRVIVLSRPNRLSLNDVSLSDIRKGKLPARNVPRVMAVDSSTIDISAIKKATSLTGDEHKIKNDAVLLKDLSTVNGVELKVDGKIDASLNGVESTEKAIQPVVVQASPVVA